MHVSKLPWCDFVVWSPVNDLFVQRVYYNKQFMEEVLSKARSFYFNVYLPSVVPFVVISSHAAGKFELLESIKPMENIKQYGEVKSTNNVKPFYSKLESLIIPWIVSSPQIMLGHQIVSCHRILSSSWIVSMVWRISRH